jgi:hypothetical protein
MPRACLTGRGAHNPRACHQPLVCGLVGEDVDDGWPGAVRAQIETDVRRVAERLRNLSEAQLAAEAPPFPSRAAGGRAAAQALADAAQALEERESGAEPRWRDVPELSDFAVGDQVALTGNDLVAQLPIPPSGGHGVPALGQEETVWARGARRTAGEVVADAAAHLAALRRLL